MAIILKNYIRRVRSVGQDGVNASRQNRLFLTRAKQVRLVSIAKVGLANKIVITCSNFLDQNKRKPVRHMVKIAKNCHKSSELTKSDSSTVQEKINLLLEHKVEELFHQTGAQLNAKDIDVLIKLSNLQDKLGGRPMLAASVAVVEELIAFLEERDEEVMRRLGEHLEEFFSRMRANYG